MSHRPLIVIPCGAAAREDGVPVYGTNQEYVRAIHRAGGAALLVPPGDVEAGVEALAAGRGLLLTGGPDVDPARYGEHPSPFLSQTEPERDELEFRLLDEAMELGLPVLGICRGMQVINAALGGTLYQHLPAERPSDIRHWAERTTLAHHIDIAPGTRLARIAGPRRLAVNSVHHQGVKKLGGGLRETAFGPDGLVEGIETADGRVLAVQCHPEELTHLAWAAALFRAFVELAWPT